MDHIICSYKKKMKEVFYETEGMPYERIERGGEPLYVENPI